MIWFIISKFTLLLFLSQYQYATTKSVTPGVNEIMADEFAHCIFQNVESSQEFSQTEKEELEKIISSVKISNSESLETASEGKDMASFMTELAMSRNAETFPPNSVKTKVLSNILGLCFHATAVPENQEFISNMKDITKQFAEKVPLGTEAKEIDTKNHIPVTSQILTSKEERRSIRRKRESLSIGDDDIQKCAEGVLEYNFNDSSKIAPLCDNIFYRGEWDDKADRTLDGDIRKLIQLIFNGRKRNLKNVLEFINIQVPKHVRELIVSYDAVIHEFEKSEDFYSRRYEHSFQRIKSAVQNITTMNGSDPADDYKFAQQKYKNTLNAILDYINSTDRTAKRESITITYQDLVNCANTVKTNLENEIEVQISCGRIFQRGVWDEKADRTLDGDIQNLTHLIFDGKSENLVRVLYFMQNYVPKYVRELIVSYYSLLNEFEKTKEFYLPSSQWYFRRIKTDVTKIKSLKGVTAPFNFKKAKPIHKRMLENILKRLNKVLRTENFSNDDKDIQRCANSIKIHSESELEKSCVKIFKKTTSDEQLHRKLKNLMHLIHDNENENILKALEFTNKYVPKCVRELILSYDAIVYEFGKGDRCNVNVNQAIFEKIQEAVEDIKNMNGKTPCDSYKLANQTYKDMLENILQNLNAAAKSESIVISVQDIQNCVNSFKDSLKNNESEVLISCYKIFNRGAWDEKANKNLDGDIVKVIEFIYDNTLENLIDVLYFIDTYVPLYVRERIVSYYTLFGNFEESDINEPLNQWYFLKIKSDVLSIKDMNGERHCENYEFAEPIYKNMMEEILEKLIDLPLEESITITELDIEKCANTVKVDLENEYEVLSSCGELFNRGIWDGKADGTLDDDTQKLIQLIYDNNKENFETVIRFIDRYVPKYVRELIVCYHTLFDEFAKNEDLSLPANREYLEEIRAALIDIQNMTSDNPAENYELALQVHKLMLREVLRRINKIIPDESITAED